MNIKILLILFIIYYISACSSNTTEGLDNSTEYPNDFYVDWTNEQMDEFYLNKFVMGCTTFCTPTGAVNQEYDLVELDRFLQFYDSGREQPTH